MEYPVRAPNWILQRKLPEVPEVTQECGQNRTTPTHQEKFTAKNLAPTCYFSLETSF